MIDKEKNKKSSFFYAFALLPEEKREAINVLYSFSRISDEIADNENQSVEEKKERFKEWEKAFLNSLRRKSENELLNNLARIIRKYEIPEIYFLELLQGIKTDLEFRNIETKKELENYAYSVASTVGLILIHILGFTDENAKDYAIRMGKALQITNIMRDVKTDAENNRVYIPQELMKAHGYSSEELFANVYNNAFVSLMEELYEFANEFYAAGEKAFPKKDYKYLYSTRAMGKIYKSLHEKIKRNSFNVFERKIKVGKTKQIKIVLWEILKGTLSR